LLAHWQIFDLFAKQIRPLAPADPTLGLKHGSCFRGEEAGNPRGHIWIREHVPATMAGLAITTGELAEVFVLERWLGLAAHEGEPLAV